MNTVTFADLVHTGTVIDADNSPLAIGYVAAYAKKHLGAAIEPRLFKYPEKLAEFLNTETPRIAAFSNYMWNEQISLAFARAIKRHRPGIVTVFGGPNYPLDPTEQRAFLRRNPEIDFYIDGEGESAFTRLFELLADHGFNSNALKSARMTMPNVHYLHDGETVLNPLMPRKLNLDDEIPSPYLMGLMDEFFDNKLSPLVQTSRGCPYSCTFCHDGISYMNKTRRFSQDRVRAELDYIAPRVKTTAITLADLNWGMFPEDIDTARDLARHREVNDWPHHIAVATAKNQKTRVIEMAKILGSAWRLGASIQSSNQAVLDNIKRTNIGIDAIVTMAKASAGSNASTYTEIILGLPGDTKERHFRSVFDMIDAGIQDMMTYQFIMLPGTEAATRQSREKYRYETRFRVLPRCFGKYRIFDELIPIAEMHEVCVGNATMPHADYLECRRFNLTLAIFNNGNIFDEVLNLAAFFGVKRSAIIARIHDIVGERGGVLGALYAAYEADEARNFWPTAEAIDTFVHQQGGIDRYLAGEYGANQIYRFRTLAILDHFEELLEVVFAAVRDELGRLSLMDILISRYLDDLRRILLACKSRLGDLGYVNNLTVHFDFISLKQIDFRGDPRSFSIPEGTLLAVAHNETKRAVLQRDLAQYGLDSEGLAHFIHRRSVRELYRDIRVELH